MALLDFRNRPVMTSSVAGGVLAAATAALGFFTNNWLVAIITVLSIVLIALVVVIVRIVFHRESEDRLGRGLEDDHGDAARSSGAAGELKHRFQDALAEIRRTLGGRVGVYELPWYLVFGPNGSGKTGLLQESGLDLPAQYASSRVFGPTQSCEFWLFNEAVAVDTAGRYFSSEASHDRDEWNEFLGLLRSSRPDCPANGLIFAISVEQLMGMSPPQIEEMGRQLRRSLNEIQLNLGLDAPIYIFITKSDQIEGLTEYSRALPADRLTEAFGWTNDQRRIADPDLRVSEAFGEIRSRLDQMSHQLIMHAPDSTTRRRIFQFPQEVEQVGQAIASFVGAAFKRDVYNSTPFLRGIYLTSSRVEGDTVSTVLQRLGHSWARAQQRVGTQVGEFMRELFRDVIILDEELAMPDSRIGPMARRAILGAGGVVSICVIAMWCVSFVHNYEGTHALERQTRLALSADPTIQQLEDLQDEIESRENQAGLMINTLGFPRLSGAVDDARESFIYSFRHSFGQDTRDNLERSLRQRDDGAFRAAVTLGSVLQWLSEGESEVDPPDLSDYMPRRVKDEDGFQRVYAAYTSWLLPKERRKLAEDARDMLARDSKRLLNLGQLENQTRTGTGEFAPISYTALGFPEEEVEGLQSVPGIYTEAGYNSLFGYLLSAVESTDSIPKGEINSLRRTYVDRYDRAWRRFLREAPTAPNPTIDIRRSPYLGLMDVISDNTDFDLPRNDEPPGWITAIKEVRRVSEYDLGVDDVVDAVVKREDPRAKTPPWKLYMDAIELVAIDVEDSTASGQQALAIARDVAKGQATTFSDALSVVRKIIPRSGDASTRATLKKILEGPILDGFSAVMISARGEIENRWRERIASQFGSSRLSQSEFDALYTPGSGELDLFVNEELAGFYDDGNTPGVLGDRPMPLGDDFTNWLGQAAQVQRKLFAGRAGSGSVAVRLKGEGSRVDGRPGMRVVRRDLRLICPGKEPQKYSYSSGSRSGNFNWSSDCQELQLRIVLGDPQTGKEEQIRRNWKGAVAMPNFLREARKVGGDVLEWKIEGDDGATVLFKYQILSGWDLRDVSHTSPPSSLASGS